MTYLIKFDENGRRGETFVAEEKSQEEVQALLDNGFELVSEEDYQLLIGNVDGKEYIRTYDLDGNPSYIEYEPPEIPLEELKAAKHNEAGAVFAKKRDAVRQVTISDGNTYGFDTCSEDITNFMASWKAAEIAEQTLYKVWQQDGSKGMIVMKLADFTTVFNAVRDSQYAAYGWYEQIVDKINAAQSKEELDAIILE